MMFGIYGTKKTVNEKEVLKGKVCYYGIYTSTWEISAIWLA